MPRGVLLIKWDELLKMRYWVTPLVLSVVLFIMAQYSFLLFHACAEGLTIIVAGMMVATAWQTYDLTHKKMFTLLAYGLFWVALIDMAHTLVYKGMNILPVSSANAATQLWIGARYLQAIVLLISFYQLAAPPSPRLSFMGFGAVSILVIYAVYAGYFPDAYVEPTGLTPFKIGSEYVIIVLLGIALLILGRRRELLPPSTVAPLGMAIIMSMGSEFAFTIYVGVYDLSNLAGHIFKLIAFWFMFIAIVRTTLAEPFEELQAETTLQQQTASDLRESEERLRTIMESAQDAIVMMDHHGLVVYWNAAAERMLGYSREEAIGQSVHALLADPKDFGMIAGHLRQFHDTGRGNVIGRTVSLEARSKGGALIPVELSVSAMRSNSHWGAVAVIRDVSERREAERQLRQFQKAEAIENMAAGIAHDFKNMLLPIVSLTGMCLKSVPEGARDHLRLQKILEAANRAANLAARILEFSREDVPAKAEGDLSELVKDTIDLLRSSIMKTIVIEERIEPGLRAEMDATQIRTVLLNLASNASDAMEGHTGVMKVTLESKPATTEEALAIPTLQFGVRYARLIVEDQGCGMDEKILSRIFDPYFTTKAVGRGTGLGLPVAHNIITNHGGAIIAQSEPGRGSIFTVFLPLL